MLSPPLNPPLSWAFNKLSAAMSPLTLTPNVFLPPPANAEKLACDAVRLPVRLAASVSEPPKPSKLEYSLALASAPNDSVAMLPPPLASTSRNRFELVSPAASVKFAVLFPLPKLNSIDSLLVAVADGECLNAGDALGEADAAPSV